MIHPDAPELNYYDQYLNKYSEAEARSIDFYSTATVQSPSYYANDNGTLVHYVTNNVKVANNYSKVTVGKAPSWMSSGVKYYSYDGIYFYTNWQNIRVNGQGGSESKIIHFIITINTYHLDQKQTILLITLIVIQIIMVGLVES